MDEKNKKTEQKSSINTDANPNKKDQNNPINPNNPNGKKPKINSLWFYVLILVGFITIQYFTSVSHPEKTTQGEFLNEMLIPGDVEKLILVNKEFVEVYLKPERLDQDKYKVLKDRGFGSKNSMGPHYQFNIDAPEAFAERISKIQDENKGSDRIYMESITRRDVFSEILSWMLPVLLLVGAWIFIFRRMGAGGGGAGGPGNIFNVGKSKAKIFDKDTNVKVDFKDVAGLEEAKVEIREIVDFLKNPKKYTDLGGKIPKGALLVGPPGTGKTLLAKAVAGEAHVPFFSMSGSDFVEMFVGVGASRVRDLFKQAKEKAPCIIFIDEIDAIGRARGKNPNFGANDERENTLNQLLTEMDGFSSNTGVIILAATNRADILDRALLRAGRFDRQIHVELPDITEREDIFKVHMKPLKLDNDIDSEFLAKQTPGFSGADIANVCNEAALIAARKDHTAVIKQDFLDAIDRIIGGLEKKNKIITQDEKRSIAFHEAGHASVSWLLEYANPLVKVTIGPRGRALGAAWYLPEERQITTTEQLLDEMCSALGGRAAEELIFGKISTGALSDLEKVTKQAYAMVSFFGLSLKVGNLSFYDSSGASEYSFNKPYSEKTAEIIDEEVKLIIDIQYKRALTLLKENSDKLNELANQLLEREVIFSEDLERIFGKRQNPSRMETLEKEKQEAKNKAIKEARDEKAEIGLDSINSNPENPKPDLTE